MQALILAAGFGTRMENLTLSCPKPLLKVGNIPLIERQINNLKRAGVVDLVINIAYLGAQISNYLGDGSKFGVNIKYSNENANKPLETGGGIIQALKLGLLKDDIFMVVNSDILTNYNFNNLVNFSMPNNKLAHLVLVDNPPHNLKGDFALQDNLVSNEGANKFTYSGISLLKAELFADLVPEPTKLASIFRAQIAAKKISGEHFKGIWLDVGTKCALQQAEELACILA